MTLERWKPAALASAIWLLPAGAAAYPGGVETLQEHIVRSAGTCPAAIAVRTASQGYEGGVKLDISVKTLAVAYVSELVSATPKRLEFSAELRPASSGRVMWTCPCSTRKNSLPGSPTQTMCCPGENWRGLKRCESSCRSSRVRFANIGTEARGSGSGTASGMLLLHRHGRGVGSREWGVGSGWGVGNRH